MEVGWFGGRRGRGWFASDASAHLGRHIGAELWLLLFDRGARGGGGVFFQEAVDPSGHVVLLVQFAGPAGSSGDLFLVCPLDLIRGRTTREPKPKGWRWHGIVSPELAVSCSGLFLLTRGTFLFDFSP